MRTIKRTSVAASSLELRAPLRDVVFLDLVVQGVVRGMLGAVHFFASEFVP
jgi:hypothetical protein